MGRDKEKGRDFTVIHKNVIAVKPIKLTNKFTSKARSKTVIEPNPENYRDYSGLS